MNNIETYRFYSLVSQHNYIFSYMLYFEFLKRLKITKNGKSPILKKIVINGLTFFVQARYK